MKVTTPLQRENPKRSLRLQKKLHVGKFKHVHCEMCFVLNSEFVKALVDDERYFEFSDSVFDLVEECEGHVGCMSVSNGKVEISLDHLHSKGDLREVIGKALKEKFSDGIEGVITATDYVDSWYWEGWDEDDPFDILAVTATAL